MAEEQAKAIGNITIKEQAARRDDISLDQIQLSLRYVRTEAAEELSSNNRLNDLRSQLWQKNILSDDEFVLLGATCDREGPRGMSQKLIDIILEKKDQHHKFLQEIQTLDPDVHNLITDNLDIVQKLSDHVRTMYKERKCHLVQVLPGEKLQLDLHHTEYVMPLVITAEKLVRQERHIHWLPQSDVKHKYKQVQYENIEDIVEIVSRGSESLILCLGIAGVGKTIFTKKIVTGWVDREKKLQGYNIVLAIPIRDVNVKGSIIDMIGGERSSLGLVTDNMKPILDYCLTEEVYASKILLLLDGVEECDIAAGSELYELISGKKYPHVKKLITARPESSLLCQLKGFYPDYKVTIQGTSKRGVYMYLREVMTDNHTRPSHIEIDSLISKCQQEMVEFNLLLIPLYLSMVGFFFNAHWTQYCTFTNFVIPNSTTNLFGSFFNILVRIWLKKIGRETEVENIRFHNNPIGLKSNIPNNIKRMLFAFWKISYDFIQQEKYTMTQADLDQYLIDVEDIKQSGMFCMSQEQGEMICFFRHKTLQEYMAALYLSNVQFTEHTFATDIDSVILSEGAKPLMKVFPKLSIVLRFLFGLDPEFCCKIINKLSGHVCVVIDTGLINLDYEASLFCEVDDPVLSRVFVELVANAGIVSDSLVPKYDMSVYNLCQAFSPQQRITILSTWYNLQVIQQGHEWQITYTTGNTPSHTGPTDELFIHSFGNILCVLLLNYQFKHVKSLSINCSDISHIGLIQRVFPKVQSIKLDWSGCFTPDLKPFIVPTSTSNNQNLTSIAINANSIALPLSSVECLTQEAGLKSLTLCGLREIPPLWNISSRGLVSWNNLSVLAISVYQLKQEKEFLEFLQNHTPKLTTFNVANIDSCVQSTFSTLMQEAMCTPPFSQLTTLRLFDVLDSDGVLALCENLPPGLHTLGVGWKEVSEVTGHFIDTLCKQCPQVKHLDIGYILSAAKPKTESVCSELMSHKASHHVDSHIQAGLYNLYAFEYEWTQ